MDIFRFHYTKFKNRVSNKKQNNIAKLLPDYVNIFQNAGKSLKTTFRFKQSSVFKHVQPEWCDQNCTDMKTRKNNALRKFQKSNSNADFRDYTIERNHFKSLCKI